MSPTLSEICLSHSQKTLDWVIPQIDLNGKLNDYPDDLACYYKLPYLLAISGQISLAHSVLDYIKKNFFLVEQSLKFTHPRTRNPLLEKFWGYVLGWIAVSAQKLGRFDLSYPLHSYLTRFQSQDHGGFATQGPWGEVNNQEMDIITTAQLGHFSLYFGARGDAIKAGDYLAWNIESQCENDGDLFLFTNNQKEHIKSYPKELEMVYVIKKGSPFQAYFMIGFPCAFLVELYMATEQIKYLDYARQYADYALSCHDSIRIFSYSHKIAWAMSLLYRYIKDDQYKSLCKDIVEHLIHIQDDQGVWLKEEDILTSFDQTIENAIWLKEISTNV